MRRFTRWFLFALTVCFAGLCSAPALANGRFPRAQTILSVPGGDGSVLYLRATFGVLRSADRGRTWTWICEQAMGFSGTWDPPMAVTKNGRLWVGLDNGLRYSDDGCAFVAVPELAGQTVRDLTIDGAGTGVIAVAGPPEGPISVYRSTGGSFHKEKGNIAGAVALTIEVAAQDDKRVYLTAQKGTSEEGTLHRSDDGGATFRELPLSFALDPGEQRGRLFVSAVDPANRDRVLFRRLSNKGSELLLSTDGGVSLTRVLRMQSAMFGFAKSPDGSKYYAASGLDAHGVFESRDRGATFHEVAKVGALCLLANGSDLLLCDNGKGGRLLSRTQPAEPLGQMTFAPWSSYAQITGPQPCGVTCKAPWTDLAATLTPLTAAVPSTSASATASASTSPSAASPATAASASPPSPGSSGCRCGLTGRSATPPGLPLLFGFTALFAWRRYGARRIRAAGSNFTPQR